MCIRNVLINAIWFEIPPDRLLQCRGDFSLCHMPSDDRVRCDIFSVMLTMVLIRRLHISPVRAHVYLDLDHIANRHLCSVPNDAPPICLMSPPGIRVHR